MGNRCCSCKPSALLDTRRGKAWPCSNGKEGHRLPESPQQPRPSRSLPRWPKEWRLTAAIPMDNPYCSCKPTTCCCPRSVARSNERLGVAAAGVGATGPRAAENPRGGQGAQKDPRTSVTSVPIVLPSVAAAHRLKLLTAFLSCSAERPATACSLKSSFSDRTGLSVAVADDFEADSACTIRAQAEVIRVIALDNSPYLPH